MRWEFYCVDLGFGRWLKDEDKKTQHDNAEFFEGQKGRIIQFDGMGFPFDGSKNGNGGKQGAVAINSDLPDLKKPRNKSSQKVTCAFGMNYDNEEIPPMFVVTSCAEGTKKNILFLFIYQHAYNTQLIASSSTFQLPEPKLRGHFLRNMKQIKGQFGYLDDDDDELRSYSPAIAFGKDGSIDTKSLIY